MPQYLREQGYRTAAFGKWNLGFAAGSRPTERGFDEFLGHASGNIDYYTHRYNGRNDLFDGIEPAERAGYSTELFADAACDFIVRHRHEPMFVYVPFNAAHFPNPVNVEPGQPVQWQAPQWAFAAYGYRRDEPDPRKRYQAVLTALDAGVGRVVDCIDRLGLRDRTLVVLLSDNGAFMLPGRGLEVASNAPFRAVGVSLDEGCIRVPCIVRWPGRVTPGSVSQAPLVSTDLLPLALSAAGMPIPQDRPFDGIDPTAALTGQVFPEDRPLYFRWEKASAMRRGRYKIIRPSDAAAFSLYDLEADRGETTDLAGQMPQRAATMAADFERWDREIHRSAAY